MAQCQSVTHQGHQCTRRTIPSSRYCWQHVSNWGKGLRIGGIIVFITAVIGLFANLDSIGLWSSPFKPPAATQKDLSNAAKDILQRQENTHNLLLNLLEINRADLKKKYQFGFGLFYVDKVEITSFNDVTESLDIDWKPAKIVLLSEDKLKMNAPSVVYYTNKSDRSKTLEFRGLFIDIPRIESLTLELQAGKYMQISMGILINRKDYVVGVIGVGKPE